MKKQVAYCGLICTDCGTYIATKTNDMEKKKEMAEKWTKEYKHEFKAEDINCAGCIAEGPHIGYCGMCAIRKCGQEKGVINCGWCSDYSCEKTQAFFKMAPQCKTTLDTIKQSRA